MNFNELERKFKLQYQSETFTFQDVQIFLKENTTCKSHSNKNHCLLFMCYILKEGPYPFLNGCLHSETFCNSDYCIKSKEKTCEKFTKRYTLDRVH